jgi:heme-degrading monooxygenase HmoA
LERNDVSVAASEFPATTPESPYYAVIFSSVRRPGNDAAYAETAARMSALAAKQPGYLGMESVRDADGRGITISYWTERSAIAAWQQHVEHLIAQRHGREAWYARFTLRISRVEAARTFQGPDEAAIVPSFADLVASRKAWIQDSLRPWCRQAPRKDLLLAEQEWFDIAGKADPAKTLWPWAWSRFPDLVHEGLGIDETAEVLATLKSGDTVRGYADARQSVAGYLVLVGPAGASPPLSIDHLTAIQRIAP